MLRKINFVLNNENGGPNLQHLIGIALSLGITGVAILFKEKAYMWLKSIQKTQASFYQTKKNN